METVWIIFYVTLKLSALPNVFLSHGSLFLLSFFAAAEFLYHCSFVTLSESDGSLCYKDKTGDSSATLRMTSFMWIFSSYRSRG